LELELERLNDANELLKKEERKETINKID